MVTEIELETCKFPDPKENETTGVSKVKALYLVPTFVLTVIIALAPTPLEVLAGDAQTTVLKVVHDVVKHTSVPAAPSTPMVGVKELYPKFRP